LEARPVAGGFAMAAVHDQIGGALGHLGIEIVHQAAQGGFLLPTLAAQPGATGRVNGGNCQGRHFPF
jgi:hypothetical protein